MKKSYMVFGQRVPIKFKNGIRDDNGEHLCGCYLRDKHEIWVDKNLPKYNGHIEKTILHELFHSILERQGLNQTNISDEVKEILCESFANFVYENFDEIKKRRK